MKVLQHRYIHDDHLHGLLHHDNGDDPDDHYDPDGHHDHDDHDKLINF